MIMLLWQRSQRASGRMATAGSTTPFTMTTARKQQTLVPIGRSSFVLHFAELRAVLRVELVKSDFCADRNSFLASDLQLRSKDCETRFGNCDIIVLVPALKVCSTSCTGRWPVSLIEDIHLAYHFLSSLPSRVLQRKFITHFFFFSCSSICNQKRKLFFWRKAPNILLSLKFKNDN